MTAQALATQRFAATPARKPLYLVSRSRIGITAEAESLVVRAAAASPRRFPLARIDRVICNRHADWSGEALCLCLARSITITWISGHGDALGQCAPRLGATPDFHTRLETFLELPDWTSRYEGWLRSRRMRVLASWAMQRAQAQDPVTPAEWEQRKREYVYREIVAALLDDLTQGACHAWVVSILHRAALSARYWGYDGHPLELAEDLAGLLRAEINLTGGTLLHAATGDREQLLFFENWARLHAGRITHHLAQLNRLVSRENESWR